MKVALALAADTAQALEASSAMVTIAPATADVALKQTIHELRNERAFAALKLVVASYFSSFSTWAFLPVPLVFVYLAVDQ